MTKPKSYNRFLIQSKTLVIGDGRDLAQGGEAPRELAARIPAAQLRMYERWGHGAYEEARDFNRTVLEFLRGSK